MCSKNNTRAYIVSKISFAVSSALCAKRMTSKFLAVPCVTEHKRDDTIFSSVNLNKPRLNMFERAISCNTTPMCRPNKCTNTRSCVSKGAGIFSESILLIT